MSVMVVDDCQPWRNFVSSTLLKQSTLQIVCEVGDGLEAVTKAENMHPDLILLDIGLPTLNGIDAAERIRRIAQGSRILFVTQESDSDVVTAAFNTGGLGYLLKTDAGDELLPAILAVLQGDRFLSSGLKAMIASGTTAAGPGF